MLDADDAVTFKKIAVAVCAVGAVLAVGIFAHIISRRARERREELWRRFALQNRLELTVEPRSWLRHCALWIRGRIADLDLTLCTYTVRAGKSTQTWVRVRTDGDGPSGSFSVERATVLTRAAALLGRASIVVDRGAFDDRFAVRSNPASLAPDVLDEFVREQFSKLTRSPNLNYSAGMCELTWHAGEESEEQLSEAVKLHAMLRGAFRKIAGPRGP